MNGLDLIKLQHVLTCKFIESFVLLRFMWRPILDGMSQSENFVRLDMI